VAGPREVYFEIARLGDVMRVTAIDSETGREATATGPAKAQQADLERLALGKLERLLAERGGESSQPERPGRLV